MSNQEFRIAAFQDTFFGERDEPSAKRIKGFQAYGHYRRLTVGEDDLHHFGKPERVDNAPRDAGEKLGREILDTFLTNLHLRALNPGLAQDFLCTFQRVRLFGVAAL